MQCLPKKTVSVRIWVSARVRTSLLGVSETVHSSTVFKPRSGIATRSFEVHRKRTTNPAVWLTLSHRPAIGVLCSSPGLDPMQIHWVYLASRDAIQPIDYNSRFLLQGEPSFFVPTAPKYEIIIIEPDTISLREAKPKVPLARLQ